MVEISIQTEQTADVERSQHLASAVNARMAELGLSPTSLAKASGLSLQAIKNVRRGERRAYQARLTVPLCRALQWTPDSIEQLLAGLEPVSLPTVAPADPLAALQAQVASLSAEVAAVAELAQLTAELALAVERLGLRVEALERAAGPGRPAVER